MQLSFRAQTVSYVDGSFPPSASPRGERLIAQEGKGKVRLRTEGGKLGAAHHLGPELRW